MNWQSSSVKPPVRSIATSAASATFDASRSRLTIDSPKNAPPSASPYSPPTSRPSRQHSTEWAWPIACKSVNTRSIGWLIQVSGRSAAASAHSVSTPAKSRSIVIANRSASSVRRSDRDRWNPSSGRIARIRGSTQ